MTNLVIGSVERLVWKHFEKLIAVGMARIKFSVIESLSVAFGGSRWAPKLETCMAKRLSYWR